MAGPWDNYAPQSSDDGPWTKYQGDKKEGDSAQPMPWGDVASQALTNAPKSALKFAKDMAQPFLHPIDTAESVGRLANAVEDKGMSALGVNRAPGFELPPEDQALPGQIAKTYEDRYGGVENLKKTLATDPVGALGDAATALTLGGGALARAPGIIGKVGEATRAVGDVANPVMGPVKAVGTAGNEAARLGTKVEAPTTEALYDAASDAYNHQAIKDLAVKPSAFKTWKDKLLATNDVVDEDLSPKTFKILNRLDSPASGSFFDGRSIQSLRRKLGQAAGSIDPTERHAARDAIESLDGFIGSIPKADVIRGDPGKVASVLADARGNYAAAKRSDRIQEQVDKASNQAGSANSGMNIDNATRQRLKDILNSDKRSRGYSPDELAQMRKIVTGTPVQNLTRRVANQLGGGGGIGQSIIETGGGVAGALAGGPVGAAVGGGLSAAAGYGLKRLSGAMTGADVNRLQEVVRSNSPLAKQTQSSLSKFGQAATMLKGSPSAKNVARFMLASKNLSTNLQDAGVNVSPESIAGTADGQ
jgi:hypothetical protein